MRACNACLVLLQCVAVVGVLLGAAEIAQATGDANCDYTVTTTTPYPHPPPHMFNGNCTSRSCEIGTCSGGTYKKHGKTWMVCHCDDGEKTSLCLRGFIQDEPPYPEGEARCLPWSCNGWCLNEWSPDYEPGQYSLDCDCIEYP